MQCRRFEQVNTAEDSLQCSNSRIVIALLDHLVGFSVDAGMIRTYTRRDSVLSSVVKAVQFDWSHLPSSDATFTTHKARKNELSVAVCFGDLFSLL